MLKSKLTLPLLSSLLLTSMAYGQRIVPTANFNNHAIFVDGELENIQSRLKAVSVYSFLNGAYAPSDSTSIHHQVGRNSLIWLNANPFNVINTLPNNLWDQLKLELNSVSHKNIDTLTNFNWSPSLNNWDVSTKTEVTDIVGNTTIARTSTRDNASIMERERRTYEYYNENGVLDSIIIETWVAGDWQKETKVNIAYDTFGNEAAFAVANFNTLSEEWENTIKYSVEKDANSRVVAVLEQNTDSSGTWLDNIKHTYSFDAEGKLVNYLRLDIDTASNWVNNSQEQYLYDLNGKHVQSEATYWDAINSTWNANNKSIFEYNTEGLLHTKINQYVSGGSYTNNNKETLVYTNGTLSSVEYSNWNSLEWTLNTRLNIEDNRSANAGTVVTWEQNWNVGDFWELSNNNEKSSFYFEEYNDDGTKIPTLAKSAFQLYPNPSTNDLNIQVENGKLQQVNILNVTGSLVMSVKTNATNTTKIDISALQTGLYHVQIITDNGTGTQKLSVVK